MLRKIKKSYVFYILLLVLLLANLVSHWYVFIDNKILLTGDWTYFFSKQLTEFSNLSLYFGFLNLGGIWAFPGNSVFYHFYFLLHSINIGYDSATRIIFILPILILTPYFSFKCFFEILKSQKAAFFAASIYTFNTFFLKLQTDFLTWAFVWWILPALILSIISWIKSRKSKFLFINSFLVFLAIAFEIRLAILVVVFSGLFILSEVFALKTTIIVKIKMLALLMVSLGVGCLFHLYWIIPLAVTDISSTILNYASPVPFVSFYTVKDVLSLHSYQWSKNLVLEGFIRQPFELRNYLIIFFVLLGIVLNQGIKKVGQHRFVFILVCFAALVFIGKQELSPIPELYGWLFHHVPLFNLYRESSKFFILIAFCVSVFFGIGLAAIYDTIKTKSKFIATIIVCAFLFVTTFYNLQHFFDQKVGGLTKGVEMPKEYARLEEILSHDNRFYRILWLPTRPDFGFNSNTHPGINAIDLTTIYKTKTNFVAFDGSDLIQNQLTFLLNQPYSKRMLSALSIRYIIVPNLESRNARLSANKSEFVYKYFEFYGPRDAFISFLDTAPYLKKVRLRNVDLDIYENISYSPHIYADSGQEIEFTALSPMEYDLNLKSKIKRLYFSESYNSNWIIVKSSCDWLKIITRGNQCVISSVHTAGNYNLNEFEGSELLLNQKVKLYFVPQAYTYLGLYLSLALLMTYIVFLLQLEKKNEKNVY